VNTCIFSEDRIYRYALWRQAGEAVFVPDGTTHNDAINMRCEDTHPYVMFIGLNPSIADETSDDPTIRKCVGFAKRWGFTSLCMTNLFALVSTDPKFIRTTHDPVGPENDQHLLRMAFGAAKIVACWGRNGRWHHRAACVRHLLNQATLHCLYRNADGSPIHPLYVPYSTELEEFAS
jgi:hypothetical protein